MKKRLIFAAMLTIMQLVGCVGIVDESVEHEIAAAREMVFDAMRDRIGALGEDRAFYCRKERWSWKSRSSDLQYECRDIDWIRFREVKPDDDPPDDGRFGDELIDLLRKCKIDDAWEGWGVLGGRRRHHGRRCVFHLYANVS